MDFGVAFDFMRFHRFKMARREWRPNKYVHERRPKGGMPYLEIVMNDGRKSPYVPSTCDLYGDDWQTLVEEKEDT
jgi:hypothetical protein